MSQKRIIPLQYWHETWKAKLPAFVQILNEHFGDLAVWKDKLAQAGNRSMSRIFFPANSNTITESFQRWLVNPDALAAFASLIKPVEPGPGEDTLDYYAKLDMNERLKKNPLYEILFGAGNPDQLREEVKVLLLLRFRFYL